MDLADLAREGLRPWVPTRRRWLACDLQPALVDADRQALIVALDALIENAVQATGPEETIEVSVTTVDRDGQAGRERQRPERGRPAP